MSKAKKVQKTVIPDSDEESDSSIPIVAQKPTKKHQVETKKAVKKVAKEESSEEEDTPVVQKKPTKQVKTENGAVKKADAPKKKAPEPSSSEEEDSEEEVKPKKVVKAKSPVQKAVSPAQKAVVAKKKVAKVPSSSEESESEEKPKKKAVVKAKSPVQKAVSPAQKAVVAKKKVVQKESSEESSEESEEVAPKKVVKGKSPLQKAVTPKGKSPLQKPVAKPKAVVEESEEQEQESSEPPKKAKAAKPTKAAKTQPKQVEQSSEEEEQEKPKSKKVKTPLQGPMVAEEADEEGEFEVCVKGLSFQAYEDDIKGIFEPFGDVLNIKLLYRDDGKSKGIAFVKFGKKSAFNKALELNGTEQFGRPIAVEQAQGAKKNDRGNAGGNAGGFQKRPQNNSYPSQGDANITTNTLFIGGLSYNSTVESISEYFSGSGNVERVRIVTDRETGKPRGFGYVEFGDVESAKGAYASLNNGYLDGRQIRLDSAAERPPRDGAQGGFGGGQRGGFGGGQRGGFGGAPRNPGNSRVDLSQDDKFAKKGAIGTFQGKKMTL